MTDNKILKLELTVDEVNYILQGLVELPGKICNPIIRNIQSQANPQLEEKQEDNGTST